MSQSAILKFFKTRPSATLGGKTWPPSRKANILWVAPPPMILPMFLHLSNGSNNSKHSLQLSLVSNLSKNSDSSETTIIQAFVECLACKDKSNFAQKNHFSRFWNRKKSYFQALKTYNKVGNTEHSVEISGFFYNSDFMWK